MPCHRRALPPGLRRRATLVRRPAFPPAAWPRRLCSRTMRTRPLLPDQILQHRAHALGRDQAALQAGQLGVDLGDLLCALRRCARACAASGSCLSMLLQLGLLRRGGDDLIALIGDAAAQLLAALAAAGRDAEPVAGIAITTAPAAKKISTARAASQRVQPLGVLFAATSFIARLPYAAQRQLRAPGSPDGIRETRRSCAAQLASRASGGGCTLERAEAVAAQRPLRAAACRCSPAPARHAACALRC